MASFNCLRTWRVLLMYNLTSGLVLNISNSKTAISTSKVVNFKSKGIFKDIYLLFNFEVIPRSIKLIFIFVIAIIFFSIITPSIFDYHYDYDCDCRNCFTFTNHQPTSLCGEYTNTNGNTISSHLSSSSVSHSSSYSSSSSLATKARCSHHLHMNSMDIAISIFSIEGQ